MLPALLFTKTPPDPGQESALFDGPVSAASDVDATPGPRATRIARYANTRSASAMWPTDSRIDHLPAA